MIVPCRSMPVLFLAVAFAVACGTPDSNPDAGDGPDAGSEPDAGNGDETELSEAYAEAINAANCKARSCLFGAPPDDVEACARQGGSALGFKAAFDAGRVTLDEAKARACVDAIDAIDPTTCWGANANVDLAALFETIMSCGDATAGQVAIGEGCYFSEECANGWCDFGTKACPGACAAKKQEGAACDNDVECAAGLECVERECIDVREAGESCSSDLECRDRLSCVSGTCAAEPLVGAGGDCESTLECAAGLYCDTSDETAASGTCTARVAAGGACVHPGLFFTIESEQCVGRQVCRGAQFDDQGDVVPGTCESPGDVGASCFVDTSGLGFVFNSGCYLGLLCDPTTTKCVRAPAVGEPCLAGQCERGAYCSGTTCRALKADGEACTDSGECEGYCDSGGTNQCSGGASEECLPE